MSARNIGMPPPVAPSCRTIVALLTDKSPSGKNAVTNSSAKSSSPVVDDVVINPASSVEVTAFATLPLSSVKSVPVG